MVGMPRRYYKSRGSTFFGCVCIDGDGTGKQSQAKPEISISGPGFVGDIGERNDAHPAHEISSISTFPLVLLLIVLGGHIARRMRVTNLPRSGLVRSSSRAPNLSQEMRMVCDCP